MTTALVHHFFFCDTPRLEKPRAVMLHDADGFLTQLTRMLERSREKGAVYVTMKRCAFAPAAPAAVQRA